MSPCRPSARAATFLLLCACRSVAPASIPSPAARGAHSCPLGVPGIMTLDDTPDGATFTFTTSDPSRLGELRRRARDAAEMYGPGAHRGLGHDGRHGGGEHHGLGLSELPPVRAVVEDIGDGARVRISALVAGEVEDVRARLHERAERVASGECP